MQSTAKVGALLLVFIVLVIAGYALLGANIFAAKSDQYFVDFADAGGVGEGTRVLLAGVNIGSVSRVSLVSPTLARVAIKVSHAVRIPVGSKVTIPGSLIGLGDSALEVIPPTPLTGENYPVGAHIPGMKAGPLDAILPDGGKQIIDEVTKTLAAVRKLVDNGKFQQQTLALLANTNHTMMNASVLTQNANGLVTRMSGYFDQNRNKLTAALDSGTQAVADVHRVTSEFARYVATGKLQHGTAEILASLTSASKKADELVKNMNAFVNDPKLRGPMAKALANTQDITETGKQIAANTSEITKNGVEISKNGIVMSQKATEIENKASAIEDQLKGVLDKVGGVLGHSPSHSSFSNIGYELDLQRNDNPNRYRTDISLSVPSADQFYTFGVYDAFESNKLTAQIGKPINRSLDYRYGIYASKPGVGVDSTFDRKFGFRGDVWDINDPKLDLRLSYQFGNGLAGWLGVDRLFNGNSAAIGIGIRK